MNRSNIEWTETSWNPTTGCTKVSAGCRNCYAERWANMQYKRGIKQYRKGFELTLATERLNDPLKWKKPQLVFVNSMSDLFHEEVPDCYIKDVFKIMNQSSIHTFQILTKRIERIKSMNSNLCWSKNIWLGVSVESCDFSHRIDHLKNSSAQVKFISFEPLLGDIKYESYEGINWVLVGGESGGKARQPKKEWVLSIKEKCDQLNIPFFFKQWGKREFNPDPNDPTISRKHPLHSKGGCMIDNKIYRDYPNV